MPYLGMSTNIILVIVGIGLLIFVHELGHFIVAKKIGVRVFAFSLGFGPPIFSKKIGETDYRISLLPLGGYVKLAGEQQGSECTGEEWEFMSKKPGQRAAVLVAGVAFNTLLAFIAFIIAFKIGVPFVTSEIGMAIPGGPAWEAGIKPGDKIVRINNSTDPDFEDVFIAVALNNSPKGVNMELERDGERFNVNVLPKYDPAHGIQRIGIAPATSLLIDNIFAQEGQESPAKKGGLQVGDEITAVNSSPISTESEFRAIEAANAGKELTLTVLRNGENIDLKATPSSAARWMIGLSCAETKIEGVKYNSFADSLGLKKGDKIVKVNSQEITGFTGLADAANNAPDGNIILEVIRGNSKKTIEFVKTGEGPVNEFFEGIFPHYGLTVDYVTEDFPAKNIGIKPGDHIVSIGGEAISEWDQLLQIVSGGEGNEIEIAWTHNYETFTRVIKPKKNEKDAQGSLGINFQIKKIERQYGLIGACVVGTQKTIVNIKRNISDSKRLHYQEIVYQGIGRPCPHSPGVLRVC